MSCATTVPAFWQRQPKLPLPVMKFMGARVEAALASPRDRALLVWPTVLGAPGVRSAFPDGIPEPELLARALPMLAPLGIQDPGRAWAEAMERMPGTAERGPVGWLPQRVWDPLASLVSLRLGVALLATLGQPEDQRYPLGCAVTLFDSALFHECHDALEPLWMGSEGEPKTGFQGLILLAGGFHHMQVHNAGGMISLWRDALEALEPFGGRLDTHWGSVDFRAGAEAAEERLDWLSDYDGERDLAPLWSLSRPSWELK